ncbi:alpha/beta hydrolase [Gordonia sinesedis]
MRPTIDQLRAWATDSVADAGAAATRIAGVLDRALDAVTAASTADPDWHGRTHDAAQRAVDAERDHADQVRNVVQQIADEAADAGTDLAHARTYVLREVDAAVADGYVVSATGRVSGGADGHREAASSVEFRIQRGLDVVDEFDERYGAILESLATDLAASAGRRRDIGMPGGRRDADDVVARLRTLTPTRRRELLSHMTSDDIRALIQADPQTIGNLNGVPFEIRAEANEINIRNALARERRASGGRDTAKSRMLTELLRQHDDPAIRQRPPGLARPRPDDGKIERRFIAFQDTENGRIIEMVGSFGAQTHNATVYIPGTGTTLATSAANHRAAWNLAQRTRGPVFFYLDGDLPQRIGYESLLDDLSRGRPPDLSRAVHGTAVDPRFAREMAPRLVDFGRELDTEIGRHAPGAATTFIGHSYGGSVLGTAEQLGLRADRVLYASSAGTGVLDGGWHNPNPAVQRYSMTAPGDVIHEVQAFGANPHGGDPDSAPGLIRLDTGFYGDGRPVAGPSAHGDYWNDPDSTAFRNMVKVITGGRPEPYVYREPDAPLAQLATTELREHGVPLRPGTPGRGPYVDLPQPLPDLPIPRLPTAPRLRLPDLPLTLW